MENLKDFTITSVCKADLLEIASDEEDAVLSIPNIERLDEGDMRRIASKMADDYCDQLYWSSLRAIAEYVITTKIRNHESCRITT